MSHDSPVTQRELCVCACDFTLVMGTQTLHQSQETTDLKANSNINQVILQLTCFLCVCLCVGACVRACVCGNRNQCLLFPPQSIISAFQSSHDDFPVLCEMGKLLKSTPHRAWPDSDGARRGFSARRFNLFEIIKVFKSSRSISTSPP